MGTLTAPPPSRTARSSAPRARPCVAGDIGPERREIECEPVADPVPARPAPAPPVPAQPAPA
ncbi:hypothetical protein SAMN05660690_1786 [Geodermatophilus telluris]|uniref:Uncharacterized protein n=1 Tax=Geodermatophilus telluris TaxID=1190417 RepID=A0A1G6MCS3_9ACTN|nr:hypothetical protein SAMN05660690_1786 [Geodermatophilus telluris]